MRIYARGYNKVKRIFRGPESGNPGVHPGAYIALRCQLACRPKSSKRRGSPIKRQEAKEGQPQRQRTRSLPGWMSSDGEPVPGVGLNRSKSARVRGHRAAGREPEACGVTTIPPALALPLRVEALLYVALTPTSECSPAPEIFFCKNAFCQKGYPLLGAETIFGQVFGRGGMTKFSKWKVPPTGGRARRSSLLDGLIITALGAERVGLMKRSFVSAYKLASQRRGREIYCDEIEVQKTRTKHRKLDS